MAKKVGFYMMDKREEDRLRIVFKMVFKEKCINTAIEDASVVIVSVEDQDAKSILNDFKNAYPDKPAIILANKAVEIDGTICLTRPCKMPLLQKAIEDAAAPVNQKQPAKKAAVIARNTANSLQEKLASKAKTKTNRRTTSLTTHESIYYNPESFLQGKVTKAIKSANSENKSVFLRCWSHRWVVVSPSTGFLIENIKERQLANLGLINVDSDVIFSEETFTEKQMADMSETPVNEVKVTPIGKFLWDITVRTARGRIPTGTDQDELYILEKWPNLTRLARIRNSMRISASWVDQSKSIKQVTQQLNIPIEDVYTFFSAAAEIGLLKSVGNKIVKIAEPNKENQNKKGLFSSILRKLSGK